MTSIQTNYQARVIHDMQFDSKGYTDENSLANAYLTKPDEIDPVLTHLMGMENKKFPLSFLSEGQMNGSVGLNDTQYHWGVVGKLDQAVEVVSYNASAPSGNFPGRAAQLFTVTFRNNWFRVGHTIESPNNYQCIIVSRQTNGLHEDYTLQMISNDDDDYVPVSELAAGTLWAMVGAAPVAESDSVGNESNVVTPGRVKNQMTYIRKSYGIAGNLANKVTSVSMVIDGQETNMWIAYEQWQHMMKFKEAIEEQLWWGKYNRRADGTIYNTDFAAGGKAIPIGAGVEDQIPNFETYSEMTAKKLKNCVRDVMFGAYDTTKMDILLYTGLGGLEEFDKAMKEEGRAIGFNQVQGDKFITGAGRNLVLGGYFTQYEHIDGHVITVKHLPLLDWSGRAIKARKHPITGLPICSYDMYFIDQSTYDGKPNVQTYFQKGRGMVMRIEKGMNDVPMDKFAGNAAQTIYVANSKDRSYIHMMASKSIAIRRNTHCLLLRCTAS